MQALGLALQTCRTRGRRGLRALAVFADLGNVAGRDEIFAPRKLCWEAPATDPPVGGLVVHTEGVCCGLQLQHRLELTAHAEIVGDPK